MGWHHRHSRRRGRRRHHRHEGWGPWGLRGRFFRTGELRLALLSLIADRPRHGYELMKELEARSGGLYRASAGSIYPTLQQLEDEGLVSSRSEGGKRVYAASERGREELELEDDVVEEIWRRSEEWGSWGWSRPHAPELWRMLKVLHRASQRVLDEDPERLDEVAAILRDARRRIRALADAEPADDAG